MSESNSNNSSIPSGVPDLDYPASIAPGASSDYPVSAAASIEPSAHVIEDHGYASASYPYGVVSGGRPDHSSIPYSSPYEDCPVSGATYILDSGSGVPDLDYPASIAPYILPQGSAIILDRPVSDSSYISGSDYSVSANSGYHVSINNSIRPLGPVSITTSIEPSAHVIKDYGYTIASYPYAEVSGSGPIDSDYPASYDAPYSGSDVPDYDYPVSVAPYILPQGSAIILDCPVSGAPYILDSGSGVPDLDYPVSVAPYILPQGSAIILDYPVSADSGYHVSVNNSIRPLGPVSITASIEPSAHVIEDYNDEQVINSRLTRRLTDVDNVSDDMDDYNEIATTGESRGHSNH